MTDTTEVEQTVRVTQLWPPDLKDKVREIVGSRGVTQFTIAAVRTALAAHGGQPAPTPAPEPKAEPEALPAPAEPRSLIPEDEPRKPSPLPEGVGNRPRATDRSSEEKSEEPTATTRGVSVTVDSPPTLGVAAKFDRSTKTFNDLLARADELNIKRASDLLPPSAAAAAAVVAKEEAVKEEPAVDPVDELPVVHMPADTKTFEEALEERDAQEPAPQVWEEPEAQVDYELSSDVVVPEPAPQPVVTRNLEDIDVDF